MKKERIFSVITTVFFFLYSLFLIAVEGCSLYGIYLLKDGSSAVSELLSVSDGFMQAMVGLWSMLGVFSWVVLVLLAAGLFLPMVVCIIISIYACISLKKQPTQELEKRKLKRDAIVKIIFFLISFAGIFWYFCTAQLWSIGFFATVAIVLGIPFILSVLTLFSCTQREHCDTQNGGGEIQ